MALKTPIEQAASDSVFFFQSGQLGQKQILYASTAINAVVNYFEGPENYRQGQRDHAVIWVRSADVVNPAYKDIVEIDTNVWRVLTIFRKTPDIFELELERNLRPKVM